MNLGIINHKEHKEHKEEKDSLSLCSMCSLWLNPILVFIAFVFFSATAQIQQAWVARYNNGITDGTNQAVKMALDTTGNICVTGFSQNSLSNLGYVTIKYAPNGNQLWAARYDSTNFPTATPSGLALDASNNVVITGSALTVKYDSSGNQLWTAPYAGAALAVDTNGNVAVTGFGTSLNTVKLTPSGSNLWEQTYPSSCGAAEGRAVLADAEGNIYVVGNYPWFCETELVDYEMLLIKYAANGSQLWTSTDGSTYVVQVGGAALDSANDVYVTYNFIECCGYVTSKYATNGNLVGGAEPGSHNHYNQSYGLCLDSENNVLVTGMQGDDSAPFYYGTFKINTNGSPVWTNYYPQPATGVSAATSITVDSANNCYVTGYSPGTNSSNDIVTIAYGPNGNQIWLQRYHGPGSGNDAGNAIAVDNNGNVYVTGYEATAAGGTEFVTIKYSPVTLKKQANGSFILQAQGSPGESFDIQASTNLQTWLNLGTVTADTNGLMQYNDTNASNFPSRFYLTNPQ